MINDQQKQIFEWNKYLNECLESTEYLCLGTKDSFDNVWTNPVWFAYDLKYNLYFVSKLKTTHMRNITNPSYKASVSIFSTNQNIQSYIKEDGYLHGLQIEATTEMLKDNDLEEAAKIYYTRRGDEYIPLVTVKNHQGEDAWKFVKIIPEHIWLFDTRFFDEERQEVPKHLYK